MVAQSAPCGLLMQCLPAQCITSERVKNSLVFVDKNSEGGNGHQESQWGKKERKDEEKEEC